MTRPDPSHLLDVWERIVRLPLQRQIVALLAGVTPGCDEAGIAALPLGMRDAMLLDLRAMLFGRDLATIAACPQCRAQLEATFTIDDVRVHAVADPCLTVEDETQVVTFRPPTTSDIFAIPEGADTGTARAILLGRCVTVQDASGTGMAGDSVPPALLPAIAEGMAQADPQAVIELRLDCAACGHAFLAIFDIGAFLMRELHHWARQTLREIDGLARVYGWRESDILALSPTRRSIYLEMAIR